MSDCVGRSGTGTVFIRIFRFSTVSIIPPMLHTYVGLHAALLPGHAWEPFKMPYSFGNRGALDTKILSLLPSKG